jgi:hypothetical protein
MFINEELTWPQFRTLDSVKKLPLNEQVQHYNRYLNDLSTQRMWAQIGAANGGDIPTTSTTTTTTTAAPTTTTTSTTTTTTTAAPTTTTSTTTSTTTAG